MDSMADSVNNCSFLRGREDCLGDTFVSILNSVTSNTSSGGGREPVLPADQQAPTGLRPLIPDEVTRTLELVINVIGLYLTSVFGVGANVINLIVYGKQGLKDSITVGFFTLSLCDLVLVSMPLITASCHAAEFLMPGSSVDFPSIHYVSSGWMRNMTYSMSCFITAFLSMERSCCIILPFQVKTIFTRTKTAVIILLAFLLHLGCILTLPAAFKLDWYPSHRAARNDNLTRILRVVFFEAGETIEMFNTTFMSLIVPSCTQVIVTISAVVLIKGLRESANFRNEISRMGRNHLPHPGVLEELSTSMATQDGSSGGNSNLYQQEANKSKEASQTKARPGGPQNRLSSRDARLVQTMMLLVTILTACNVPFLVATFAWRFFVPEMNIGRSYENMLRVSFSFVYLLGNLNASVNVFVYYNTSTNFRHTLHSICCSRASLNAGKTRQTKP